MFYFSPPTLSPEYQQYMQTRRKGALAVGALCSLWAVGVYVFTIHSISTNDFAEYENERRIVPISNQKSTTPTSSDQTSKNK